MKKAKQLKLPPNPLTVTFKTETGSVYRICCTEHGMTWARERAKGSGNIRAEHGELVRWPTVAVGARVYLEDRSVRPGYNCHMVLTSVVTELL